MVGLAWLLEVGTRRGDGPQLHQVDAARFELEDGTGIIHRCLGNPATVLRVEAGTIYEGMFVDFSEG